MASLVLAYGSDRVFVVSKAGRLHGQETWLLFKTVRFFERTGMLKDHVYFCNDTADLQGKGALQHDCRVGLIRVPLSNLWC